jgi:hypothetical protein
MAFRQVSFCASSLARWHFLFVFQSSVIQQNVMAPFKEAEWSIFHRSCLFLQSWLKMSKHGGAKYYETFFVKKILSWRVFVAKFVA